MSSTAVARQAPEYTISFEGIAKKHWPELYTYAYRLSGNRCTAEDVVQESLVRAWRSIDKLKNPNAFKGWLYTIVRRENARRFERYQPVKGDTAPEDIADRHQSYDTSTEAFALRNAIRKLPGEYRDPLLLQVIYGYSQQEIADRLGLSCAGVGTRIFRARQKLRSLLGEFE